MGDNVGLRATTTSFSIGCPQSSVAVTRDCLVLLALGHGLKQLVPRMLWRVSSRVGPPYFRAGDASLNMPPQSCTLRLKVMHGHGVANQRWRCNVARTHCYSMKFCPSAAGRDCLLR